MGRELKCLETCPEMMLRKRPPGFVLITDDNKQLKCGDSNKRKILEKGSLTEPAIRYFQNYED